ncbi:MAG: DUF2793 domain-containing protein [Bauldia sp.]
MSDPLESVHLKIPYLAAAQAQKHVTHNEALRRLDTVVQLSVIDSALTDPPASPAEGDRYIVASPATGAWTGEEADLAAFIDGGWQFLEPDVGWLAFDVAAGALLVRAASAWEAAGGLLGGTVDQLGNNPPADATNRLAVRSNAVLFSNVEDASGGTGDVRFVVNKEAAADAASLLFQTGFSGRAEVGLVGDDDFVFKVSPDGSAWTEAIRIDKDTGLPAILYDNGTSGLTATTVQEAIDEVAAGGGGGGAVASVFGRTGAVVAATGDYDAGQVDNDSGVSGATVKDALDALNGGKQAADSDLTAVAGLAANGLIARTGAGTAAARTLTGPAAGMSVANGDGVAGNPTLAPANDLAGLEGLAGSGIAVRTAADTWAQRTITGSNGVAVAIGDGVAGNPAIAADIANATDLAAPARDDELLLADTSAASAIRKADVASIIDLATPTEAMVVACSDETTALSAGTAKVTFRMPYAFTLAAVRASLTTAQASGSIFTVDLNEGGTTLLSTKLTVDNTEKTSTTAAAAPVISDASLADDAEITVDIDQIGDGTAKGLKLTLIGNRA